MLYIPVVVSEQNPEHTPQLTLTVMAVSTKPGAAVVTVKRTGKFWLKLALIQRLANLSVSVSPTPYTLARSLSAVMACWGSSVRLTVVAGSAEADMSATVSDTAGGYAPAFARASCAMAKKTDTLGSMH
jgi:hypothetical protein